MSLSFRASLFLGFLAATLGCFYLLSRSQAEDAEILGRITDLQAQLGALSNHTADTNNALPTTLQTIATLRNKFETALQRQRPDLLEPVWRNLRDDIDMLLAEAPIRRSLMADIATLKLAMKQAHELSWQLEKLISNPPLEKRAAQHQLLIAQMRIALDRLREDGNALGLEANLVALGRSIHQLLNEDLLEELSAFTKEMAQDQLEDLSVLLREHASLFRRVIQQAGTFVSLREVHQAINHGTSLIRAELTVTAGQRQTQIRRREASLPLALSLLGITLLAMALLVIELIRIARVQANRATRLQKYRRQSRAAIGEITEAIRELVQAADHPMALRHDRYGDIVEAINELLEARGKRYQTASSQTRELSTIAIAAQEASKQLLTLSRQQREQQQHTHNELNQASQTLRQTAAEARSFGESLGRVRSDVDAEQQSLATDSRVLKHGMKGFSQAQTALTQWDAPLQRLQQLLHEMGELTEACNILAINATLLGNSDEQPPALTLSSDIEHIQSYVGQLNQGSRKAIAELEQMQAHGLSAREITQQSREEMATHSRQTEQRMDALQTLSSRMRSLANQSADLLRAAEAADHTLVSNTPTTEAIEETAVLEVSDWIANVAELADALHTGLRALHTLPKGVTVRKDGKEQSTGRYENHHE